MNRLTRTRVTTTAPQPSDRLLGGDRIGRNTVLNMGGLAVPVVLSLATVPAYISAIGLDRYGALTLAWLILGSFGVFNLGLGRATANQIATLADSPPERRQVVFWTALSINFALGLAGAACLLVTGHVLASKVLALSSELQDELLRGLPWFAAAVVPMTVAMVCVGALDGIERFDVSNAAGLAAVGVSQLLPLIAAYALGPDLQLLMAAAAAGPFVGAVVSIIGCWRLLPLRRWTRPSRDRARALFSYGGWVTVSDVIAPLLTVLDRFVIGAVSGPRAVAHYTVPMNLVSRLSLLPFSLTRSLFPRLSSLPRPQASHIALEATQLLAAAVTPILVIALLLLDPFLRLWIDESFADAAAPVAQIIVLGSWINSLSLVPYTYLQARGRPHVPAKLHLLELMPYLAGLWIGLSLAGLQGAAWAWTARVLADALLLARASGLYTRHQVHLVAPAMDVLAAYVLTATIFDAGIVRLTVGGFLVALAGVTAWHAAPEVLRARIRRIREARASQ